MSNASKHLGRTVPHISTHLPVTRLICFMMWEVRESGNKARTRVNLDLMFQGKLKSRTKVKRWQSPEIETRAPNLSCQCSDHSAMTIWQPQALTIASPHNRQPSQPPALTIASPHNRQPSQSPALTITSPHILRPFNHPVLGRPENKAKLRVHFVDFSSADSAAKSPTP